MKSLWLFISGAHNGNKGSIPHILARDVRAVASSDNTSGLAPRNLYAFSNISRFKSDLLDFFMQNNSIFFLYGFLRHRDKRAYFLRGAAAFVDEEVRVLFGYHDAPDSFPFQPRAVDQKCRGDRLAFCQSRELRKSRAKFFFFRLTLRPRVIFEYASAALGADILFGGAFNAHGAYLLLDCRRISFLQLQCC